MEYPKVFIIIVNWNGKEDTIECLESLKGVDYPNYRLIVVDNGSTDGSQDELRKIPGIVLIETGRNLGYAGGVNVGIEHALKHGADYVFLLNNDCIVDKGFLKELIRVAQDDEKIGIAGPIIYFYDEPNKLQEFGGYISLTRLIKGGIKPELGVIDKGQFKDIRYVDYVAGGACLIKKEVIEKIGMFDPSYFLYWEETDYDMRAKQAGFELAVVPTSKIWHKVSASTVKSSNLVAYYMTRNKFIFVRNRLPKVQFLAFTVCHLIRNFPPAFASYLLKRRDSSSFRVYLRGLKDGLQNVTGPLKESPEKHD